MATVTIEALKVGDETDALVRGLRRMVSGNTFREAGPGRWRVELNDSGSGDDARDAVEAQLDEIADAGDWRENLRVNVAD
jgi:hypothetical protein